MPPVAPATSPDDTTWNRFAPAALRHALCRHGADAADESFEAAVLLADVSGYSALAARLAERGASGPETLSQLLNASFEAMLREVHARGGEVERFAGDALLATFRPLADTLAGAVARARDCAQAITARLDGSRAGDVDLGVHAGVAAGTLNTRHLPLPGGDRVFVMLGEPLRDAAAAVADAARGEVRLTPAAEQLAARAAPAAAPRAVPLSLARHADLAPYIRGALRDRLDVAADASWLAELRRITAVFVMPRCDATDATTLARVAQVLDGSARRFEGLLHELGVDDKGLVGVLLFGLGRTHEDQAQRALRAAHAVHQGLAQAGLHAALGVASGRVYCGVVGDEKCSELAVVGDAMNLAARLMQAAGDGVLCDSATAAEESAQRAFRFEALPELRLKGMAAGVTAQRPMPRTDALETPARRPTLAPLGRAAEWQVLLETLSPVAAAARGQAADATAPGGPARALLIEGDPGIGKSALLEAAAAEAARLGAALIRMQGQELEQVSPYNAWRGAVAQLLGVDLAADRSAQLTRLRMSLAAEPEMASLAPLLAAVLPHAPPTTGAVESLDAQARSERLRELLLFLLARAAAVMPLVLVVEDAHWLDSASWALLQAGATQQLPLIVLASSRPLEGEARAPLALWQAASGARVLELGPLSREAAAELMRRKLGVSALTEGVEALVHERAAGHPYFTEELVLALRDAGALRLDGGLCSLAVNAGDRHGAQAVPDTLERALTVRIDAVGEAQRFVLKVASVLGRDFALHELEAVYPLERGRAQLPSHLARLVDHELLLVPLPGHFRFKHAITRDVAYGLLPFGLRRDLHRSLAEHLQRQEAHAAAPQSQALLAHHWSQAQVADKALAASEAAGLQAMARFANREAVYFLREALRWNEQLGRPTPHERVAQWHSTAGLAHRLLGELQASRQSLEAALRELRAPVPAKSPAGRLRLGWALLQFAFMRPHVGQAGEPANAANTAVDAYAQLAMLAYYEGDVELMTACTVLAGRVAQRAAPSREVAALHGSLAHTAVFFRLGGATQRLMASTQSVAQRVPTPLVIGTACQFTGHLAACQGDFTRYAADMTRAHDAYAELGRCRQLEEAETNLTCLYTHTGQLERAHAMGVALERSGRARDDLQTAGWGVVAQARARLAQGRHAEVLATLENSERLTIDTPTRIEVAATRSRALLRSGLPAEALERALEALSCIESVQSTSYFSLLPYGHTMDTLVRLAVGDDALAAARAREAAPRMLKAWRSYAALLPVARIQLAVWTGALAEVQGRPADALRAWRSAWRLAQVSQVPLDTPMACRWLARGLAGAERRAMLEQAAEAFAALEHSFDAEEARAAARGPQQAPSAPTPAAEEMPA